MPSERVNITFTGSASPYTSGDKASFPMAKAKAFIRRGVAHFTNPDLRDNEKAIRRVRLGDVQDRMHSVHGNVTSGKDFQSPPDEFDRAMRGGAVDVDERGEPLLDKDGIPLDETGERSKPIDPRLRPGGTGTGAGRLGTQDSAGHSMNVGEHGGDPSLTKETGVKTAAEAEARRTGTDPVEAGATAEREKQAAEGDAIKEANRDAAAEAKGPDAVAKREEQKAETVKKEIAEQAEADKAAADAAAEAEAAKAKSKTRTRL